MLFRLALEPRPLRSTKDLLLVLDHVPSLGQLHIGLPDGLFLLFLLQDLGDLGTKRFELLGTRLDGRAGNDSVVDLRRS